MTTEIKPLTRTHLLQILNLIDQRRLVGWFLENEEFYLARELEIETWCEQLLGITGDRHKEYDIRNNNNNDKSQ